MIIGEHDLSKEGDEVQRSNFSSVAIHYKYEEGLGGTLSVGLNGAPFSPDYSLIRWTDSGNNALRRLAYVGFTASAGTTTRMSLWDLGWRRSGLGGYTTSGENRPIN